LLGLLVSVALASAAVAAPKDEVEEAKLGLFEAFPGVPLPGVLTLRGQNFPLPGGDRQSVVCLGEEDVALPHSVVDAGEIQASLPLDLPPGSYRVTVASLPLSAQPTCPEDAAKASANLAVLEVALGVQGEQGVPGPQGETGPVGPEGPPGPVGATGATGPAGADGTSCTAAQGDGSATVSCSDGTSATVYDGAEGPPGPEGPAGPPGPTGDEAVAQLEAELERTRAAACAEADFRGVSYRPFTCEPRCGCIAPDFLAQLESCEQTAPGTFVASQSGSPSACVESPPNVCSLIFFPSGEILVGLDACASSSEFGCFESSDCPSGEVCGGATPFVAGRCHVPCESIEDCPQPPPHCETSIPCNFAVPCPSGWTCSSLLGGSCQRSGCTSDADCAFPALNVTLAGVGSADDPAAVDCSVTGEFGIVVSQPINSNDALYCISQIEAVTGACQ
jgi:hypothetical protein